VPDGAGAGGVARQHAADRAFLAAGLGGEAPADGREGALEVGKDDAGLHADGVAADVEDGAEVQAEIDDETGAQAGAGTSGSWFSLAKRTRAETSSSSRGATIPAGMTSNSEASVL
jgi:hypothetical protein